MQTSCDLRSQEDTNKNKSTELLMLLKHIHGQVGGYRQPQIGPLCRMKILLPAVRNNKTHPTKRYPAKMSPQKSTERKGTERKRTEMHLSENALSLFKRKPSQ